MPASGRRAEGVDINSSTVVEATPADLSGLDADATALLAVAAEPVRWRPLVRYLKLAGWPRRYFDQHSGGQRTAGSAGAMTSPTGNGHAFTHEPDRPRGAQRRALWWALGLNAALLVVEGIGGVVFHSLALLADAVHLVSDVVGLGIAAAALVLAARPVSARHSFGFARAEVLAAQVSALLLLGAGGWILVESVHRLRQPVPVDGAGLAAVASLGLVVNLGSSVLVHRSEGQSLNMRASFVHLATDAVGSLGAIVAGLLVLGWGVAARRLGGVPGHRPAGAVGRRGPAARHYPRADGGRSARPGPGPGSGGDVRTCLRSDRRASHTSDLVLEIVPRWLPLRGATRRT